MHLCRRRGKCATGLCIANRKFGHDGHGDLDNSKGRYRLRRPAYLKLWYNLLNLTRIVFAVRADLY